MHQSISRHGFDKIGKSLPLLFALMTSHLAYGETVSPRAGAPLPGLTSEELTYFSVGQALFKEVEGVQEVKNLKRFTSGGGGLGPRFNLNGCVGCHSHPAVGGSSPPINPEVAMATELGAKNKVPYFVKQNGPVFEARFKLNPDGTPDGGVHNLFVITGRSDAGNCNIKQPDFDAQKNNIALRIPTPLFGTGLIQEIPEATIIANKNADAATKRQLGISGHENRNENDGTITRFGWKAQNKSLLLFAGEAYNVEQGVTSELFQNKRDETPGCVFNGVPEDHTIFDATNPIDAMSDIVAFTQFMRFLAPPTPKAPTPESQRGAMIFASIGCAMCHTPSMKTGRSSSDALSNQNANLYSDLLVHHMGTGLADGITQGKAGPDEFRTAPLWGVGERLFLMHDGRAKSLTDAIKAHAGTNSEANKVIAQYNLLTPREQSDLIKFLHSL